MPRAKVSTILDKIDYDKCIQNKNHSQLANSFDSMITSNDRTSLRAGCDNRKKNIFKDLKSSLREVVRDKINQEGEILTNKLLGTTTKTRKENRGEKESDSDISTDSEMDELVQTGDGLKHRGRKRKHHSRKRNTNTQIKKKRRCSSGETTKYRGQPADKIRKRRKKYKKRRGITEKKKKNNPKNLAKKTKKKKKKKKKEAERKK